MPIEDQFQTTIDLLSNLIEELQSIKKQQKKTVVEEIQKNKNIEESLRNLHTAREHIMRAKDSYENKLQMVSSRREGNPHIRGKELLLQFIQKNYNYDTRFPWEISLGNWKPDAIIKVDGEWRFLEFETNPRNIEEKLTKAAKLPDHINRITHKVGYIRNPLNELKGQIKNGMKPYIYIGFLERPNQVILDFISLKSNKVRSEVFEVNIETNEVSKINQSPVGV